MTVAALVKKIWHHQFFHIAVYVCLHMSASAEVRGQLDGVTLPSFYHTSLRNQGQVIRCGWHQAPLPTKSSCQPQITNSF